MLNSNDWFELRVWVREAKNLENRKLVGSNSPFVEVTFGNETKKTQIVSNLNDAIWDEKLIFRFNKWEELSNDLIIKVKDENTLLPNVLLGEYHLKLDKDLLYNKYKENPNYVIHDGYLNLENCNKGQLDVQILFKFCNEFEPSLESPQQQNQSIQSSGQPLSEFAPQSSNGQSLNQSSNQTMQYSDQSFDQANQNLNNYQQKDFSSQSYDQSGSFESKFQKLDVNETHILPTIHVKAKPTIIEKEIEYTKPIEIKETIVHREKPIIVEQPIIKEKNEHYREEAKIEQTKQENITESVHKQDVGNLDKESLQNLRQQYQEQFMDNTPIIQQQKEQVLLDTDYREQPTQIKEKEVVYQQPIEIEKTLIEQVKPKVREDVKVEKEHVYQKLAPELHQENVQYVNEDLKKEQEMRQQ